MEYRNGELVVRHVPQQADDGVGGDPAPTQADA